MQSLTSGQGFAAIFVIVLFLFLFIELGIQWGDARRYRKLREIIAFADDREFGKFQDEIGRLDDDYAVECEQDVREAFDDILDRTHVEYVDGEEA